MTSEEYDEYLKTDDWKAKRDAAVERADGKCQLCAATDGLQVHHNTYERVQDELPSDLVVLCSRCHQLHHAAVDRSQNKFQVYSIQDVVRQTVSNIESLYQNQDDYTGIASGFHAIDNITLGFHQGEFIVVGARPSVGKTAFGLSVAKNVAMESKLPAAFLSLEMATVPIGLRLISMESGAGSQIVRSGMLRPKDFASITNAANRIFESPLWIVGGYSMGLSEVVASIRYLVAEHDVRIVIIDYLTLIRSNDRNTPRHEQVAEISRVLKALAMELNIPVVALSQLTRDTESRRPLLSSLRESGSIEQDADVVVFLHREKNQYYREDDSRKTIPTEVIVAKNRNGPVGSVTMDFKPNIALFENSSEE